MRTSPAGRLLLVLVATCLSIPALAQDSVLAPGAILRVQNSKSRRFEGRLVRLTPDSLLLEIERAGTARLPRAELRNLERQVGSSRARGAARGAMWLGAFGIVARGLGSADPVACRRNSLCSRSPWLSTTVGGLEWGAIGALLGSLSPVKRWAPVDLRAASEVHE